MTDDVLGKPLSLPTNPGALPLRKAKQEAFARHRAIGMPALAAARAAGYSDILPGNAARLDRNRLIRARIAELTRQDVEIIKAKAEIISQFYMSVLSHDPADIWEKVQLTRKDGTEYTADRARHIADLAPEVRQCIESVRITENGWIEPKVYSKLAAAEALRKQHGIGVATMAGEDDIDRMTYADINAELAHLAQELGIEAIRRLVEEVSGQ